MFSCCCLGTAVNPGLPGKWLLKRCVKKLCIVLHRNPSQSHGASLVVWDHSVTCHPTQVKAPVLTPVLILSLPTPEGWKAEVVGAGYMSWWFFCLQTVTHPSSNRARCRATSFIATSALTTTLHGVKVSGKHHGISQWLERVTLWIHSVNASSWAVQSACVCDVGCILCRFWSCMRGSCRFRRRYSRFATKSSECWEKLLIWMLPHHFHGPALRFWLVCTIASFETVFLYAFGFAAVVILKSMNSCAISATGRSGLTVTCLTVVWEDEVQIPPWAVAGFS